MHLENGKIISDDPNEELFLAEAKVYGMDPISMYPHIAGTDVRARESLKEHFEDGERSETEAALRGLVRMSVSHKKYQPQAVEWLARIAEEAVAANLTTQSK